jgi:hypothetical protein
VFWNLHVVEFSAEHFALLMARLREDAKASQEAPHAFLVLLVAITISVHGAKATLPSWILLGRPLLITNRRRKRS